MSVPDAVEQGIAVDIGGTKTLVTSTAADGEVVRVATARDRGAEGIVEQIAVAVEPLAAPLGSGRVVVASPGDLDTATGTVRYAANLPFVRFDLAGALSERLRRPVRLVGDATAATVAEFCSGAAAGARQGAYVTVSTGIGMGLVVDGRLVAGLDDQAGELGHIPVRPGGAPCGCGQRGCLEAYASGRGLADRARDACREGAGSSLRALEPERISARDVVAAARREDDLAMGLVDDAVELLAGALATLVRLLAPQVLVLGGGVLGSSGLMDPVRERVVALLEPNAGGLRERIRPAVHGQLSALRGAAAICRADEPAVALMGGGAEWLAA